jgi:adenylate kinase
MVRSWPNIALTGTPGTGKSTHAQLIIEAIPAMRHIDTGPIVKENGFHIGYDEEYETYDVDEDALLDYIEPLTGKVAPEPLDEGEEEGEGFEARESDDTSDERGGLILDWHSCEAYPERWVDLVVVLRCNHEILWKRLEKR